MMRTKVFDGIEITAEDYKIAQQNGITALQLYKRIVVNGWGNERARTEPIRKQTKFPKGYIERAKENGIPRKTVYQRVRVLKWGIEDAVTIPPLSPSECLQRAGDAVRTWDKTLIERAEANGINAMAFKRRIIYGWDVEEAIHTPLRGHNRRRHADKR